MAVPKEKSRQKTTPVSHLYQPDGTIGEIKDAKARDRIAANKADADGKIDALDGRLNTAETNITNLDSKLSTYPRPNLLDNWYFAGGGSQIAYGVFPINQRGQTSYSAKGYSIDRWTCDNYITTTLYNGNLAFSNTDGANRRGIDQPITNRNIMNGKVVTGTILLADGNLYTNSVTFPTTFPGSGVEYLKIFDFGSHTLRFSNWTVRSSLQLMVGRSTTISIVAIKLELGDTQTLAHQENGVWVLNEVPDYGEQLAKCQGFFQTFRTQALRPTYGADFRPVMATATPTPGTISIGGVTYYTASSES